MKRIAFMVGAIVLVAATGYGLRAAAFTLLMPNYTDSLPRGLYIRSFEPIHRDAIVWFRMPEAIRPFIHNWPKAEAWYDQPGNGFLKPVVAISGDTICRDRRGVFSAAGKRLGVAALDDGYGHRLPAWRGCKQLGAGEMAVFSDYAPDSVDSRYFGTVSTEGALTYRPFILNRDAFLSHAAVSVWAKIIGEIMQ